MTTEKITERIADYKADKMMYITGRTEGYKPKKSWERYARPIKVQKKLGLNAKVLTEWFAAKRPDAKVSCVAIEITKERNCDNGVAWTRGTYSSFLVTIEVDGKTFTHNTAQTYRKNHEILDFMLNHTN